jgi:hypothetical protein
MIANLAIHIILWHGIARLVDGSSYSENAANRRSGMATGKQFKIKNQAEMPASW